MKKILLAACVLTAAAAAYAAIPYEHSVLVNTKSGESVEHKFSETPAAAFEGDDIVFSVKGAKVSYPIADVQNFTFNKTPLAGIEGIEAGKTSVAFAVDAGTLYADGLAPGEELAVFLVDGKKTVSAKADADGSVRVDIGHLASGAYIAASARNSFKFIK